MSNVRDSLIYVLESLEISVKTKIRTDRLIMRSRSKWAFSYLGRGHYVQFYLISSVIAVIRGTQFKFKTNRIDLRLLAMSTHQQFCQILANDGEGGGKIQ